MRVQDLTGYELLKRTTEVVTTNSDKRTTEVVTTNSDKRTTEVVTTNGEIINTDGISMHKTCA
ncbi:MAG: hypothetical protein ACRC8Y_14035 [Chroococcales cyanobacterium]